MNNQYLCPHCRGHLRVGSNIVFKIRNARREKGLLLMHPETGNYSSMKHPQFHLEEGERIDFFCPICMQSLDASLDKNLVQVVMIDQLQTEHEIFFSRIAGEQSTYQVSEEDVKTTGEHFYRYTYFKTSEELFHSLNN